MNIDENERKQDDLDERKLYDDCSYENGAEEFRGK